MLGTPARVESVGETEVSHSLFLDFVIALGDSAFGPAKFDRRSHNSNAFCKEVTQFLCGKQFPLGGEGGDDDQVKFREETCLDVYAQGGYTEFYTGIENYSVSYYGAVERF